MTAATEPAAGLLSTIEHLPLDTLVEFPGNPRIGDVAALVQSLSANEQYEPIVVQASTRHILAGNHRAKAARELGWETIAAVVVDVDDDHARRIALSSNRIPDLGSYDTALLAEQLRALAEFDALEGTGYTGDDLDQLLAQLAALDNLSAPDLPPLPDAPLVDSESITEVVLLYSKAQRGELEAWLKIVAKEKKTNGVSETIFEAARIAALQINRG